MNGDEENPAITPVDNPYTMNNMNYSYASAQFTNPYQLNPINDLQRNQYSVSLQYSTNEIQQGMNQNINDIEPEVIHKGPGYSEASVSTNFTTATTNNHLYQQSDAHTAIAELYQQSDANTAIADTEIYDDRSDNLEAGTPIGHVTNHPNISADEFIIHGYED